MQFELFYVGQRRLVGTNRDESEFLVEVAFASGVDGRVFDTAVMTLSAWDLNWGGYHDGWTR
jgi:hypothetical protein